MEEGGGWESFCLLGGGGSLAVEGLCKGGKKVRESGGGRERGREGGREGVGGGREGGRKGGREERREGGREGGKRRAGWG